MRFFLFPFYFLTMLTGAQAQKTLENNSLIFTNAPAWVTSPMLNTVVQKVENKLEWSTRKAKVLYFADEASFARTHGFKGKILALAKKNENIIYLGPRVNAQNFNKVLAHELSHIVIHQKFKGKIPAWLEEGVANMVADNPILDYKWLARQKRINVFDLSHPIQAQTAEEMNFYYYASFAFLKMLEAKCGNFRELLNLSLRSKMQDYFATYCRLPDANQAFWTWVERK